MCSGFGKSPAPTIAPDCAIDVQVGDLSGIYLPNAMGTMLYLAQTPDFLFDLQMIGDPKEGVDKQAALTGLATLAAPRLAALPLPTAAADIRTALVHRGQGPRGAVPDRHRWPERDHPVDVRR